jgi:hypothetical protein
MHGNARPARSKFEGWRRVDENGGGMDSQLQARLFGSVGARTALSLFLA